MAVEHDCERGTPNDDAFDATLRARHRQALTHVSARTQAQLRQRTRLALSAATPASHPRRWALATAAALAFVGVSAVYLDAPHWRPHTDARAIANIDAVPADTLGVIEETPDLYLWLASDDARQFAME